MVQYPKVTHYKTIKIVQQITVFFYRWDYTHVKHAYSYSDSDGQHFLDIKVGKLGKNKLQIILVCTEMDGHWICFKVLKTKN